MSVHDDAAAAATSKLCQATDESERIDAAVPAMIAARQALVQYSHCEAKEANAPHRDKLWTSGRCYDMISGSI